LFDEQWLAFYIDWELVMNTFEAIEQRRAVKHFDPAHELTQEEIDKLLGLAKLSLRIG